MKTRSAISLCLFLFLFLFLWLPSAAQQVIQPQIAVQDPRRRNQEIDPLEIQKMEVEIRVHGCIAETSLTMTFGSEYHSNLEGSFSFPLPPGATVSGYALDIRRKMVEGVAVDKEWATYAFETEVRKSIDPGLVERSEAGVFRTRVYPIPPEGSRTVMLRYVTELDSLSTGGAEELRYALPLRTDYEVDVFDVSIAVISDRMPLNRSRYGLQFGSGGGWYQARFYTEGKKIEHDIAFGIPGSSAPRIWLDYSEADGETYFVIQEPRAVGEPAEAGQADIRDIYILWDASGSAAGRDLEPSYELLDYLIAELQPDSVQILPFRDTVGPVVRYLPAAARTPSVGDMLTGLARDGATSLASALEALHDAAGEGMRKPGDAVCFLFSDGVSNADVQALPGYPIPIFCFHSGPGSGLPVLQMLAGESGGGLFDLSKVGREEVLKSVRDPAGPAVEVEYAEAGISHVYWKADDASGSATICGKMAGKAAELAVRLASGSEARHSLNAADARSTGILRTYWAQNRMERLSPLADLNEEELKEIGRRYGLVTPVTSLLVLETLGQYLTYRIRPPDQLAEMQAEYDSNFEYRQKQQESFIAGHYAEYEKWWSRGNPEEQMRAVGIGRYEPKVQYRSSGGCFPAGTPVLTSSGSKDIEAVEKGERAYAYDWETGEWRLSTVIDTQTHAYRGDVVEISSGGEKIEATGNHPFWVVSGRSLASRPPALDVPDAQRSVTQDGRWVEARYLEVGDMLLSKEQGKIGVTRLSIRQEELDIYNFTVSGLHTYAVHESGIVVHNKGTKEKAAVATSAGAEEPVGEPAPSPGARGAEDLGPAASTAQSADELQTQPAGVQVLIKAWEPSFTYLRTLSDAGIDAAYGAYLELREGWSICPAFFLDCADWFFNRGMADLGQRVISNLLELDYLDPPTLKAAAFLLEAHGKLALSRRFYELLVRAEPATVAHARDLALVEAKLENYDRSLQLLSQVVMTETWTADRTERTDQDGSRSFSGERLDALIEYARILGLAQRKGIKTGRYLPASITPQTTDLDLRITASWTLAGTDIGLLVIEPSGEPAYYDNIRTEQGGIALFTATHGYGPDAYHIREAPGGDYLVKLIKYHRGWGPVSGPAFVKVSIYTDFGRPNEKLTEMVRRMPVQDYAVVDAAEVSWD